MKRKVFEEIFRYHHMADSNNLPRGDSFIKYAHALDEFHLVAL
jgi:hypothetical protein